MMDQIADLAKSDRLYLIVKEFAAVDLHPNVVSGHDMGYMFEELIRKFAESDSTQAGDHFTPREVIELMVDILFLTQGEVRPVAGAITCRTPLLLFQGGWEAMPFTPLRRCCEELPGLGLRVWA